MDIQGNIKVGGGVIKNGGTAQDIFVADGTLKKLEDIIGASNTSVLREVLGTNQVIMKDIALNDKLEQATYYGNLTGIGTNYYMYFPSSSDFFNLTLDWVRTYIDNDNIGDKFYSKVELIKQIIVPDNDYGYKKQYWIDNVTHTAPDVATMLSTTYVSGNIIKIENGTTLMLFTKTGSSRLEIRYIGVASMNDIPVQLSDATKFINGTSSTQGGVPYLETGGKKYEINSDFVLNKRVLRTGGVFDCNIVDTKLYNNSGKYIGYFKRDNVYITLGNGYVAYGGARDLGTLTYGKIYFDKDYYYENLTGKSTSITVDKVSSYLELPKYFSRSTSNLAIMFDILVTSQTVSGYAPALVDDNAKVIVKYSSGEIETFENIILNNGKIENFTVPTTGVQWVEIQGESNDNYNAINIYDKYTTSEVTQEIPKYNYGLIDINDSHSQLVAGIFDTQSGGIPLVNTRMLYHQPNTPEFLDKIIREHNLSLIFVSLESAAYTLGHIPIMKDFIGVGAHGSNENIRIDYFPTPQVFQQQVILVSSDSSGSTSTWQSSYGNQVEFYEQTNGAQSEATAIVAGKLAKIKEATNASWEIIRKYARVMASNGSSWDMYHGYGIIDVNETITVILGSPDLIEYKQTIAKNLNDQYNISKVLSYEDISENSPVPKRLLDTMINSGLYNNDFDI